MIHELEDHDQLALSVDSDKKLNEDPRQTKVDSLKNSSESLAKTSSKYLAEGTDLTVNSVQKVGDSIFSRAFKYVDDKIKKLTDSRAYLKNHGSNKYDIRN